MNTLSGLAGLSVGYGAGQLFYSALEDADRRAWSRHERDRWDRSPSPTPPSPTASLTAPETGLSRRNSLDGSLAQYIRDCCIEIVGTEGQCGLDNRQVFEQIFFLQNRSIEHFEQAHDDSDERAATERSLRQQAKDILERNQEALNQLRQQAR